MLFNISTQTIDIDQLTLDLTLSNLSDISAELAIVQAISDIQEEQFSILEAAELYAERIYQFSDNEISLHRSVIESSQQPSLVAEEVDIGISGLDFASGFITSNSSSSVFRAHYWILGDSVGIQNDMYSLTGIDVNYDTVVTRELTDILFLKKAAGETLVDCSVSTITGDIRSHDISLSRAINLGDAKRFYMNIASSVDMDLKVIRNNDLFVSKTSVSGGETKSTSLIKLSSLKAESGVVNLGNHTELFLIEGGFASDESALNQEASTNTVFFKTAVKTLLDGYAPASNWQAKDLKKADVKDNQFMLDMAQNLINGNPPAAIDGFKSPVTKGEVSFVLDSVLQSILNMDVCNDN